MKDPQFHDFDIMFAVQTEKKADDLTADELRTALVKRIMGLSDQEMLEACGWCGTYNQSDLEEG